MIFIYSNSSNLAQSPNNGVLSNSGSSFNSTSKTNKKIKQFENILSQKIVNMNDLKTAAWKGIPFGS